MPFPVCFHHFWADLFINNILELPILLQGERTKAQGVCLEADSVWYVADLMSSRGCSKHELLMWFYASVYLGNLN